MAAAVRPEFASEYRLRVPAGQKIRSVSAGGEVPLRELADGSVAVKLEAKQSYRVRFA